MEVRIITKVTHECVEQAPLYRQFIENIGSLNALKLKSPS